MIANLNVFLMIAKSSLAEVEAQATIAADINALDQATALRLIEQCNCIAKMIYRLAQRLDSSG